jgi:hypothetical protein
MALRSRDAGVRASGPWEESHSHCESGDFSLLADDSRLGAYGNIDQWSREMTAEWIGLTERMSGAELSLRVAPDLVVQQHRRSEADLGFIDHTWRIIVTGLLRHAASARINNAGR